MNQSWLRNCQDRDPLKAALDRIRKMNRAQLIQAVSSYPWWHSIDLGDGIITPGIKSMALMQAEFENTFSSLELVGKSVLDIGSWNGGFAIEALRRGASRVVALDHYTWNHHYFKGRETFELACRATGMQVEAVDADLDEPKLNLTRLGQFDIVLFLGVFYHLKNPLSALIQIVPLVREVFVLETHIEHSAETRPIMVFYPGEELAGDSTNWWGPNTACVVELLKAGGFCRVDVAQGSDPNREIFHARRSV